MHSIHSAPHNLDKRTTITIDDRTFIVEADDLEKISDLGHGAYGIVEKMRHRQTNTVMAVKRITATVNTQEQVCYLLAESHKSWRNIPSQSILDLMLFEFDVAFQKRLLMDLDISMRSSACPYTVHFYGALFREGDVWICMEVMDTSLDKFYPKVYKNGRVINEDILGKV